MGGGGGRVDFSRLKPIRIRGRNLQVALRHPILRRQVAAQRILSRIRMVREIAHYSGSHVEAQNGVALRVILEDAAQIGGKPGEAVRCHVAPTLHRVLVVNEAGAYLAEQTKMLEMRAHLEAEETFHDGLRAL